MATANDSLSVADSAMGAQGGEAVRGMSGMTKIAATALAGVAGSATAAGLPSLPGGVAAPAVKAAAKPAARKAATGLTDQQAASFLLQAQISCTKADIAAVRQMGYAAWLSREMGAAQRGITGWNWLIQNGYNRADILYSRDYADPMIWAQLINPVDGLRKRVALALSEILVVSTNSMEIESPMFAMAAYWDLLMRHAFGNFRTLLGEITLNPAMGHYLSMRGSQKADARTGRRPDENYAREILQLFTIGLHELNLDGSPKLVNGKPVETYTAETVTNLARVFTGYDYDRTNYVKATRPEHVRNPLKVNVTRHSTEDVHIFGVTIAGATAPEQKLARALDVLFNHPNVAPFIARQLIQRLVKSNPTPAYIRRVASAFSNNGQGVRGDLRHTVAAVLLDSEARNARANDPWHGKVREPMIRFAQWAATFGAKPKAGEKELRLFNLSTTIGQSPLRSPSVFNFFAPDYIPPNTVHAKYGRLAPELQIADEASVVTFLNTMNTFVRGWQPIVANYATELALAPNARALVEHLNLLLSGGQLSERMLGIVTAAVEEITPKFASYQQQRVFAAILFIMSTAEYTVQK